MGPPLFILFIGDIDTDVHHTTALSFADDSRITMKVRHPKYQKMLQENLNVVYKWADTNNMMFNVAISTKEEYKPKLQGSETKTEMSVRNFVVTLSSQG